MTLIIDWKGIMLLQVVCCTRGSSSLYSSVVTNNWITRHRHQLVILLTTAGNEPSGSLKFYTMLNKVTKIIKGRRFELWKKHYVLIKLKLAEALCINKIEIGSSCFQPGDCDCENFANLRVQLYSLPPASLLPPLSWYPGGDILR